MAFVKVVKSFVGTGHMIEPVVRMSCHLQSSKQSSRALGFSFSRPAIEAAGWPIGVDGERTYTSFSIHEGTGSDAGFLLLIYDMDGYRSGGSGKRTGTFSVNISINRLKHYVLNEQPPQAHEQEDVGFTIDKNEKSILIQCPDWLRYNPLTAPKEVEEEKPPVTVAPINIPVEEPKDTPRPLIKRAVAAVDELAQVVVNIKGDKPNRAERRHLAKRVSNAMR